MNYLNTISTISALAAAVTLGACSSQPFAPAATTTQPTAAPPPIGARGTVRLAPVRIGLYNPAELTALVKTGVEGPQMLRLLDNKLPCSVNVHAMQYHTVGGRGEPTWSSGALMTPSGGPGCSGPRPVVVYAHGTYPNRHNTVTDMARNYNDEPHMLAAMFAAQGFIVVAPNYAGLEGSPLPYHPYHNADQQSKEMIDALQAARSVFAALPTPVQASDKLFLTGYSQGGFVAMATHRAMQAAGMKVAASAPLSGAYALALYGDEIFKGKVGSNLVVMLPQLVNSFQQSYGTLYRQPSDMYSEPYAQTIEKMFPADNFLTLISSGRLPPFLFSKTAPQAPAGSAASLQPALNAMTPPVTGTPRDALYARMFGEPHLVNNPFRLAYLMDEAAFPDGADPARRTPGLANPGARHPFRQALQRNDLRDWTPTTPVLICGSTEDPLVPYNLNGQVMADRWATLQPGLVTAIDMGRPSGPADNPLLKRLRDEYQAERVAVVAKATAAGAKDGGAMAVVQSAHHHLTGLPCKAAALNFFQERLRAQP